MYLKKTYSHKLDSVLSDTSLHSICLSWAASTPQSGQSTRIGTLCWWSSSDTGWSWRASSTSERHQRFSYKLSWVPIWQQQWHSNNFSFNIKYRINNVVSLSEMFGALRASGKIRRKGCETGLSWKAAHSAREVACGEEHWVSDHFKPEINRTSIQAVVLQNALPCGWRFKCFSWQLFIGRLCGLEAWRK